MVVNRWVYRTYIGIYSYRRLCELNFSGKGVKNVWGIIFFSSACVCLYNYYILLHIIVLVVVAADVAVAVIVMVDFCCYCYAKCIFGCGS